MVDIIYREVWSIVPKGEKEEVLIELAAKLLKFIYNEKNAQTAAVDFSDSDLRYAYIYRYFTTNVYCVSACWGRFNLQKPQILDHWLHQMSEKSEMKIVSLGSGHASDIVGLCHWLHSRSIRIKINAIILDTFASSWAADTKKLLSKLFICGQYCCTSPLFISCDIFHEDLEMDIKNEIADVNLVTIVKCLSTAPCHKIKIQLKLMEFLHLLPASTMIMFMDDDYKPAYNEIMTSVADVLKLQHITQVPDVTICIPPSEIIAMNDRFEFQDIVPLKENGIVASLWLKN